MKRPTSNRMVRTLATAAFILAFALTMVGTTGCDNYDDYDDYYDYGRGHDCIISTLDNSFYCY